MSASTSAFCADCAPCILSASNVTTSPPVSSTTAYAAFSPSVSCLKQHPSVNSTLPSPSGCAAKSGLTFSTFLVLSSHSCGSPSPIWSAMLMPSCVKVRFGACKTLLIRLCLVGVSENMAELTKDTMLWEVNTIRGCPITMCDDF